MGGPRSATLASGRPVLRTYRSLGNVVLVLQTARSDRRIVKLFLDRQRFDNELAALKAQVGPGSTPPELPSGISVGCWPWCPAGLLVTPAVLSRICASVRAAEPGAPATRYVTPVAAMVAGAV